MSSNYVAVNGMRWGQLKPLMPPIGYDAFADALVAALARPKENFRSEATYAGHAMLRRAAYHFSSPNLSDPLQVGWALLLPPRCPETEAIATALDPLVQHRKGQVIYSPVSITSATPDVWIADHYNQMDTATRPYYVLLAGDLPDVPFRFQYNLDVVAAVGRLSFDTLQEYETYANKVVGFETSTKARVLRHSVVFATEHPSYQDNGATFLSRHFMTDPLVAMMQQKGIKVTYFAAEKATLPNLVTQVGASTGGFAPALVYTATHGLGVPGIDESERRRMQGALVCQDYDGHDGVFAADSVPNGPFLHGSIVMSFACYGAGTPQRSDFFHWCQDPALLECCPATDFVASLPRRMLAHAQGPLAFIGHIDPSWSYSFVDPKQNNTASWGNRMGPFRHAVELLFQGSTIGYAANAFNEVYAVLSVSLASTEDEFQRDRMKGKNPSWKAQLVDQWMTRNDMQNFILLGDPAVRLQFGD